MTLGSRGVYEALKKLFVTDKDGHITVDGLPNVTIGNWPSTYPDTATEPRNVAKWGGTTLTGRDISSDLALLQPPTSIGTLGDVTAAASATQLTASSTACRTVIVRSLAANTSVIRVGDSNVSASRGAELSKGDAIVLDISNVNKVYVFGNAADKVSVTYVN